MTCGRLVVLILAAQIPAVFLQQQCISAVDVGNTTCLSVSQYEQSQISECLTDSFITGISNGSHICQNSAQVCWYPCVLKKYDRGSGFVPPDCRCGVSAVTAMSVYATILYGLLAYCSRIN